jgi:hypothetical protein
MLKNLYAILNIPNNESRPLRLHHPSFCNFLLNKDWYRDTNFQVNKKQTYQMLADWCLQLISKSLKQDIRRLDALGALVANINSSRVECSLPSKI